MQPNPAKPARTALPWCWRKLTPPDHQCFIPSVVGFTLFCWLTIAICPWVDVCVVGMIASVLGVLLVLLLGMHFQIRNGFETEKLLHLRFSFMAGVGAVHGLVTMIIIQLRPSLLPMPWMLAVVGILLVAATIGIAELAAKRLRR